MDAARATILMSISAPLVRCQVPAPLLTSPLLHRRGRRQRRSIQSSQPGGLPPDLAAPTPRADRPSSLELNRIA